MKVLHPDSMEIFDSHSKVRVIISGGPGSGCTSIAKLLSKELRMPVFDSDAFFHRPTNPPFQEQYSPDERRKLLSEALAQAPGWILSGSIATWGLDLPVIHFGFFLNTPKVERLRRLKLRERERFGSRIEPGGDMHLENCEFMEWASGYEERSGRGRNRSMDRDFLIQQCNNFIEISHPHSLNEVAAEIRGFLSNLPEP